MRRLRLALRLVVWRLAKKCSCVCTDVNRAGVNLGGEKCVISLFNWEIDLAGIEEF